MVKNEKFWRNFLEANGWTDTKLQKAWLSKKGLNWIQNISHSSLLYPFIHSFSSQVALQPAQKGAVDGAPSSYQFVGSNDAVCNDGATWTVLCEDTSDRKWRSVWEVRYCKVKPEMTEKFRCLGIRALANHRPGGGTSMRNIRMWQRIEAHREEAKMEL